MVAMLERTCFFFKEKYTVLERTLFRGSSKLYVEG
jgi:hypothetical protein